MRRRVMASAVDATSLRPIAAAAAPAAAPTSVAVAKAADAAEAQRQRRRRQQIYGDGGEDGNDDDTDHTGGGSGGGGAPSREFQRHVAAKLDAFLARTVDVVTLPASSSASSPRAAEAPPAAAPVPGLRLFSWSSATAHAPPRADTADVGSVSSGPKRRPVGELLQHKRCEPVLEAMGPGETVAPLRTRNAAPRSLLPSHEHSAGTGRSHAGACAAKPGLGATARRSQSTAAAAHDRRRERRRRRGRGAPARTPAVRGRRCCPALRPAVTMIASNHVRTFLVLYSHRRASNKRPHVCCGPEKRTAGQRGSLSGSGRSGARRSGAGWQG